MRHGIDCPTVTAAGTGSFEFETGSDVYTELQCGSYIFMDADYGRNRDRDGEPTKAFEPSLFVWATVVSRPAEDRAIVDAGLKALAFDSGPPLVCDELPRPMSEPRTSTAGSRFRPAPTGSGSGQDPADPPATATRPSTPTLPSPASGGGLGRGLGTSVCVRARRANLDRCPREVRYTDYCRPETSPTGKRSRIAPP